MWAHPVFIVKCAQERWGTPSLYCEMCPRMLMHTHFKKRDHLPASMYTPSQRYRDYKVPSLKKLRLESDVCIAKQFWREI